MMACMCMHMLTQLLTSATCIHKNSQPLLEHQARLWSGSQGTFNLAYQAVSDQMLGMSTAALLLSCKTVLSEISHLHCSSCWQDMQKASEGYPWSVQMTLEETVSQ